MDRSQRHSESESRTLELSGALRRLRGDRKLLKELIVYFLEDYELALDDIHRAARDGRLEKLTLAAHNLKGLAANFDAQDVVDAATAIELHAKESDAQCALNLIPTLDDAIARLVAALKLYLNEDRNGD